MTKRLKQTNSQWVQNVSRLLKHNGFLEVANSPSIVIHKVFFSRLKDCYLQEFRYSTSLRIKEYIQLGSDRTKYDFHDFLEVIKDILNIVVYLLNYKLEPAACLKKRLDMRICPKRKDPALYARVELRT